MTYQLTNSRLRVEVRDWADGLPRLKPTAPDDDGDLAEGGRGLAIVATLSDRWGVIPRVIGKSVWFEINLGVPHKKPSPGCTTSSTAANTLTAGPNASPDEALL